MSGSRYRAFISYSHKDRAWADWLHRALESYTVPKHLVGRHTSAGEVPARIAPVFRDREELAKLIQFIPKPARTKKHETMAPGS